MTRMPQAPAGVVVLRTPALEAWVLPYGARLMQLWWLQAPEGPRPLSLGFADPADYAQDSMSIGAVCGRYANRIADARLDHQGQHWLLNANHPMGHCIHGGREGMGQQIWQVLSAHKDTVVLCLDLPDGHMGFPGRCLAQVTYQLDNQRLSWHASARVDALCPLNLVQHSYWNLDAQADLRNHRLQVHATHYLPTDTRELPLQAVPVDGGCFDFRQPRLISADCIDRLDGALRLDKQTYLRPVAHLSVDDLSMTVSTDRPWLHVYAAGGLKPTAQACGVAHLRGTAVCLETEDLPNGPALGAPVWYGPGRNYEHRMVLDFTPQA